MHRIIFYIFSLVFLIVYTFQKQDVALPAAINNYLNDFLCLPIVLHLCRYIVGRLTKNKAYRLSLFTSLSVAAYYTVYFEYLMPEINSRYTADPLDAVLYFCGAVLYNFLQKQSVSNSKKINPANPCGCRQSCS